MAIGFGFRVTIEFVGAPTDAVNSDPDPWYWVKNVRLVESEADGQPAFAFHAGNCPGYTLAAEESQHLLHLLGQIEVAPGWGGGIGADGKGYELVLIDAASKKVYGWWEDLLSPGWESVREVFAMSWTWRSATPLHLEPRTSSQPAR